MGPVITTNSATLVNKGLEVIEAHLLFGIGFDRIDVVVHPQSMVHSMVEFIDGSTLAQCSPPDMRLPIALALGWPDRVPAPPRAATGRRRRPGSSCRWTTRPSRPSGWPARSGAAGRDVPGGLQRGQRGVRRRPSTPGRLPFLGIVDTVARVVAEHEPPPDGELTLDGGAGRRDDGRADRVATLLAGSRRSARPCDHGVVTALLYLLGVAASSPSASPSRSACTRSATWCRPSGSGSG